MKKKLLLLCALGFMFVSAAIVYAQYANAENEFLSRVAGKSGSIYPYDYSFSYDGLSISVYDKGREEQFSGSCTFANYGNGTYDLGSGYRANVIATKTGNNIVIGMTITAR